MKAADRLIAEECLGLLKTKTDPLSWKVFLSSTIERLKQKVIVEWSINFYQPLQQLLLGECLENKNVQIEKLFNSHKLNWEKYLKEDGLGIFVYLNEITGLNLQKK